MGWGAIGGAGLGLGQTWANNPNLNAPSWLQNGLSTFDPIGKAITGVGGDPLNLYGNKNNPNALLFPSGTGQNAAPNTLPPPAGSTTPNFYDPNSFGGMANLGPGGFNAMASRLAGPQYVPSMLSPQGTGSTAFGGGSSAQPWSGLNPAALSRIGMLRGRMGLGSIL